MVEVVEVVEVNPHPTRDGLTVNTLSNGAIAVSNLDGDKPRYSVGDLVVHVPERSIVPGWLLHHQGCWDEMKQKGTLAGGKGNRVKNRKFDEIVSEGMLYNGITEGVLYIEDGHSEETLAVVKGQDVSEFLDVTIQSE